MNTTAKHTTDTLHSLVQLHGAEDVLVQGPRPETYVALDRDGVEVYRSGYRAVAEHYARQVGGSVVEE